MFRCPRDELCRWIGPFESHGCRQQLIRDNIIHACSQDSIAAGDTIESLTNDILGTYQFIYAFLSFSLVLYKNKNSFKL
jgi:hypothetical protein